MSTERSGQKQGSGCLAFLLILSIIVGIAAIYFAATQKPFNYPLLLVVLANFALVAFAATPWYRRLRERFPSAASLILVLVGTYVGIGAASSGIGRIPSSQRLADVFQNFLMLLIIAIPVSILLFAFISWLAERKLARAESVRSNIDQSESSSASTEYRSIVLVRFLGLTVKYARYGMFSILSLSDEDE